MTTGFRPLALGALAALLVLSIAWEAWLVPSSYAPRFWLVAKAGLLAALMLWLWRGPFRRYLYAALLMLFFFTEGVVLAWTAHTVGNGNPLLVALALLEALLATAFIVIAALHVRAVRHASAAT